MADKLKITACSLDKQGQASPGSDTFEVMLNPAQFSHQHSISYTNADAKKKGDRPTRPLGQTAPEPKFGAYDAEKVNFEIVMDGTGAVQSGMTYAEPVAVAEQVKSLRDIVYKYVGTKHEPSVVEIKWGSFAMFARLQSMALDYTLFKPDGEPLRARAKLAFVRYVSNAEEALRAERSSADLTHVVQVKDGDTLPLLCYRIYNDSAYYLQVARFNQLVHFRDLKPGLRLRFPPLR